MAAGLARGRPARGALRAVRRGEPAQPSRRRGPRLPAAPSPHRAGERATAELVRRRGLGPDPRDGAGRRGDAASRGGPRPRGAGFGGGRPGGGGRLPALGRLAVGTGHGGARRRSPGDPDAARGPRERSGQPYRRGQRRADRGRARDGPGHQRRQGVRPRPGRAPVHRLRGRVCRCRRAGPAHLPAAPRRGPGDGGPGDHRVCGCRRRHRAGGGRVERSGGPRGLQRPRWSGCSTRSPRSTWPRTCGNAPGTRQAASATCCASPASPSSNPDVPVRWAPR